MTATTADCEDLVKLLSWGRRVAPSSLRAELTATYGWSEYKARSVIARAWDEGYVHLDHDLMVHVSTLIGTTTIGTAT